MQLAEIAHALSLQGGILLLDESTASINGNESAVRSIYGDEGFESGRQT